MQSFHGAEAGERQVQLVREPPQRRQRLALRSAGFDHQVVSFIDDQQADAETLELLVDDALQIDDSAAASGRADCLQDGGREKLVAWLKFLENRSGGQIDPTDPIATYDFGWLWRELGVEALRR